MFGQHPDREEKDQHVLKPTKNYRLRLRLWPKLPTPVDSDSDSDSAALVKTECPQIILDIMQSPQCLVCICLLQISLLSMRDCEF